MRALLFALLVAGCGEMPVGVPETPDMGRAPDMRRVRHVATNPDGCWGNSNGPCAGEGPDGGWPPP